MFLIFPSTSFLFDLPGALYFWINSRMKCSLETEIRLYYTTLYTFQIIHLHACLKMNIFFNDIDSDTKREYVGG